MTLKYALISAAVGIALTASGCPEDNEPTAPNFEVSTGDGTGTPDGGGDAAGPDGTTTQDVPPSDTPAVDISTDVSAPAGTVKALQLKAEDAGCDPNMIQTIAQGETLTGVIVTSPKYDAFTPTDPGGTALDGYFVRDADGDQWNGIFVTIPRDDATDYQPGDVLDLSGELVEFYCQTQLSTSTHSLASSGTPPAGIEVPPAQVNTEAFEGVLLTVKGVEVVDEPFGGVYTMTGGFTVTFGFEGLFLSLDAGKTYDITGILFYDFGEYKVRPRFDSDIVDTTPGTGTTINGMQTSDASVNCTDPGFNDIATGLTLDATVAVGKFSVTDSLDGYILTDGTGGPNSGVFATVPGSLGTDFAVGTEVRLNGKHMEFFCSTQFQADTAQELSTGNTVPAPTALTISELSANTEQYEGTLVELSGVTLTAVSEFNEGDIEGSGIIIDDTIFNTPTLTNGTTYSTVIGVITYNFSKYRVSPRSEADLVVGGGTADPAPDAGTTDATADATPDAAADAGPDAAPDAAADATPDATPDAAADATPDAAADAAADAAGDAAADAAGDAAADAAGD